MEETDIDIRGFLALLRRRLGLIAASLAACVVLAGLAIVLIPPVHSATALILLDPGSGQLLDPETQRTGGVSDGTRIDSEVEIVRSDAVLIETARAEPALLSRALETSGLLARLRSVLGLEANAARTEEETVRAAAERLGSAIRVTRRGLTQLIAVEARAPAPQDAAALANAVAQTYIAAQIRAKTEGVLAAMAVLDTRLEGARAAALASATALDAFLAEARAETGGGLMALATDAERALGAGDWGTLAAQLESEPLGAADAQRQALVLALAESTDADDAGLAAQLAAIELALAEEGAREMAALRARIADPGTEAVLDTLDGDALARLADLRQAWGLARGQYETLAARNADLRVQAQMQMADARIVSPAVAPGAPSFPNPPLILAIAGALGLGLGLGLALVHENFVGGFVSETQLAMVTRTPVVADLPAQKPLGEAGSAADMVVAAPLSRFSEAVRRARAGIDRHLRRAGGREPDRGAVIAVTSAVSQEGKTSVALALARTYALAGRTTLLIDCDLRRPAVHDRLGLAPGAGLFDYLAGRIAPDGLAAIIGRDDETGLSVIMGARPPGVPTDQLVTGGAFLRLLAAARDNFEVIVLDTPPVLPVVDALYLAQYADIVLLVVKWAATAQSDVRGALRRLDEARPPQTPLLTLLNQTRDAAPGYGPDADRYHG